MMGPLAVVACGEEYTIFVSAAREVFCCGLNNVGQVRLLLVVII